MPFLLWEHTQQASAGLFATVAEAQAFANKYTAQEDMLQDWPHSPFSWEPWGKNWQASYDNLAHEATTVAWQIFFAPETVAPFYWMEASGTPHTIEVLSNTTVAMHRLQKVVFQDMGEGFAVWDKDGPDYGFLLGWLIPTHCASYPDSSMAHSNKDGGYA